MASVEKRVRDGKITWLTRYREPDGTERKRSFRRRVDAERFRTGVDARILDGTYVDPSRSQITLGEWATPWLAGRADLKPSTLASYRSLLTTQVLPTWGTVPLARITHSGVVAWVAAMRKGGLSASRTRQAYHVLTSMLNDAVGDHRLPRNPAKDVKLPPARKADKRFLTHGQVVELAEACGPYRLLVLVLAYCGLRWGEAAALRVGRVDLLRRRLEVVESVTEVNGVAEFGTPKNKKSRSVPVPRSLLDELASQVAGKPAREFVFTSPEGAVLRLGNFRSRYFDRAAKQVGLEGFTPHELRHTAASLAVSAGANVKSIQTMLGHASAAMTLDVYSGLFDDDLDAVAEGLDAALLKARVPPACPESVVVDLDEHRSRV